MSSFRSRSENDHSHSTIDNRAYSNINDEDDDEEEDDNFDEDDEESDVENNGNDDYYENPEELRINNISRNNLFLASLGIEVKNDVINQEKNEEIVIENEIDNTINSNNNEYIKDEIEKKMKLDNLIYYQSFYLRKNEISRIIGYLDRVRIYIYIIYIFTINFKTIIIYIEYGSCASFIDYRSNWEWKNFVL